MVQVVQVLGHAAFSCACMSGLNMHCLGWFRCMSWFQPSRGIRQDACWRVGWVAESDAVHLQSYIYIYSFMVEKLRRSTLRTLIWGVGGGGQ